MKFREMIEEVQEREETGKRDKKQESVEREGYGFRKRELRDAPVEEEILSEHDFFWRREEMKLVRVKNDRAFFRLETNLKAVIVPMEHFGLGEVEARVLNISGGGMGIGTKYQCCVGDKLLLKVRLVPEEEVWNLFCQVVWIEEKGIAGFVYGCRMIEMGDEEQKKLMGSILKLEENMRR